MRIRILTSCGAGMTLMLLAVALAASAFHDVIRTVVLPVLRWVQVLSALLVIAAGLYIIWYQLQTGLKSL